jgi:hypothetical protein
MKSFNGLEDDSNLTIDSELYTHVKQIFKQKMKLLGNERKTDSRRKDR